MLRISDGYRHQVAPGSKPRPAALEIFTAPGKVPCICDAGLAEWDTYDLLESRDAVFERGMGAKKGRQGATSEQRLYDAQGRGRW